jgi:hypothetical protein
MDMPQICGVCKEATKRGKDWIFLRNAAFRTTPRDAALVPLDAAFVPLDAAFVQQLLLQIPHLRLSIPPELKYKYLRNDKANFFHSKVKKLLFQ